MLVSLTVEREDPLIKDFKLQLAPQSLDIYILRNSFFVFTFVDHFVNNVFNREIAAFLTG